MKIERQEIAIYGLGAIMAITIGSGIIEGPIQHWIERMSDTGRSGSLINNPDNNRILYSRDNPHTRGNTPISDSTLRQAIIWEWNQDHK